MSAVKLLSYIKALIRRGRVEENLSEELQFHLYKEIEKYIAAGTRPRKGKVGTHGRTTPRDSAVNRPVVLGPSDL